MSELTERAWKHRFAERFSCALILGGATAINALEDAYAHADDQYPIRQSDAPEQEADAIFSSLEEVPRF